MKKYLVFVNERGTKRVEDVKDFIESELNKFLTDVKVEKKNLKCFKWGDFLYKFDKINNIIEVNESLYCVITLKQVGYYYIIQTYNDGERCFETIDCSKSFTTYEECYDSMKLESMQHLASDIDVQQDFEDGCECYHYNVSFKHNEIKIENKIKYTLFCKL